jgi:hypothetical protein
MLDLCLHWSGCGCVNHAFMVNNYYDLSKQTVCSMLYFTAAPTSIFTVSHVDIDSFLIKYWANLAYTVLFACAVAIL